MEKHLTDKLQHTDLYIYQCGSLQCENGHEYGPAVRDHFLIHFIRNGKGTFEAGKKLYHLSTGQGFLICPDVITTYKADDNDPWFYSWIGFHGLKAESYLNDANLTADNPIFTYTQDDYISNCFIEMDSAYLLKKGKDVKRLAYLYLFLFKLIEMNPGPAFRNKSESIKETYVNNALWYIEMNYSRRIRIEELSRHVGLNRSYLNTIFKESMNMTLQEYVIEYRVRKAAELLLNKKLSIGDISRSVGYDDPLLFSKIFKKVKQASPSQYRKALLKEMV